MILISFIIPIFNTQKYLEDLIMSLNQEYYKSVNTIDIMRDLIVLQPNVDIFIFKDIRKKLYLKEKLNI